jgi:hypothetical protein
MILRGEQPSQRRPHAQRCEELRADVRDADIGHAVALANHGTVSADEADLLERLPRAGIIPPIGRRRRRGRPKTASVAALEQHHHSPGVPEWQRTQQHVIDNREHGRRRSDPEAERGDRHDREGRRAPQRAQRESRVGDTIGD